MNFIGRSAQQKIRNLVCRHKGKKWIQCHLTYWCSLRRKKERCMSRPSSSARSYIHPSVWFSLCISDYPCLPVFDLVVSCLLNFYEIRCRRFYKKFSSKRSCLKARSVRATLFTNWNKFYPYYPQFLTYVEEIWYTWSPVTGSREI